MMVERKPRDKFLILATGGLWDHVSSAEAGSFIQTRLHTSSPDILAKELAELAMRKGSLGNVTLVIILFNNF
jgi:serine/threonine protein phosphatase PrpC